jgi:nicotinamide mononucleotide (NMN) deamidase PncC
VTTLHLVGIGESALVDVVGVDVLAAQNPRMATYARADFVDLRVSAVADGSRSADELVATAVAGLYPRLEPYAFARDEEDWTVVLTPLLAGRSLALAESGTGGYLGLLLGSAPFVRGAEQRPLVEDAVSAAAQVRARVGAEVGLVAVARESADDMEVTVVIDIDGDTEVVRRTAFRAGDTGRRRCANAAIAELWRRLSR